MANVDTSRVTSKYQATIPKIVRECLGLRQGDLIAFDVGDDGVVRLRRAVPLDVAYADAVAGTLSEWETREDDEAYGDL